MAAVPVRTNTNTSDDANLVLEDSSEATRLLLERLRAWKHACGYLEDYISATEKVQNAHSKEYEKVLKTVSQPLKEAHHFESSVGGVSELFDNIRSNTQGISYTHSDTAKALKGTVLPIFERLHQEIKNKSKEIEKNVGKGSKSVDKARNATEKHVELLGQHSANYQAIGSKPEAQNDPYVIQRGIYHRLNKQLQEENVHRGDMIQVQNNFSQFETHVVDVFQQGIDQLSQVLVAQSEKQKAIYGNVTQTAQKIDPLFEFNRFVGRNNGILIDPNAPPRTMDSVGFANQDHKATQPLIQGSLGRKSGLLKKWDTSLYVVTPTKFLHEFKTDDNLAKDPIPELSLYLPDCTVGILSGSQFNINGRDVSGGKVATAMTREKEFAFRAHTDKDGEQWYNIIKSVCGKVTNDPAGSPLSPTSPEITTSIGSRNVSGQSSSNTPSATPISPVAGGEGSHLAQAGTKPATKPTELASDAVAESKTT